MSDITLSDFVGYVFSEMVRARDLADRESCRIAQVYAKDDILKSFSVPRFKIPEMELTIPVLISGARFSNDISFVMKSEEFVSFLRGKLQNAVRSIYVKQQEINVIYDRRPIDIIRPPVFDTTKPVLIENAAFGKTNGRKMTMKAASVDDFMKDFFEQLMANQDPMQPDNIIQTNWHRIFWKVMEDSQVLESYRQYYPKNELFLQTLADVTEKVKQNTIVRETKIENLLVNPETNLVKNGSTEASVFLVKAKIIEEGIFIRSVTDPASGEVKQITEFE